MPKRDRGDELGRSLVQLLRHGAHEANVPIDDEGWVALDAALAHVNRRGKSFTVADVEQSVAACAKQRMALRTSPAGARQIRANQGHSMKDVHVEMKRLDAASAPEAVVHGTYRAAWAAIREAGLSRMARQHVHFARDLPGESGVISGMRSSCQVLVWVDLRACIEAGMEVFESSNGVILTPGFDGVVPPRFFRDAQERSSGRSLMHGGGRWPGEAATGPLPGGAPSATAHCPVPEMQNSE